MLAIDRTRAAACTPACTIGDVEMPSLRLHGAIGPRYPCWAREAADWVALVAVLERFPGVVELTVERQAVA